MTNMQNEKRVVRVMRIELIHGDPCVGQRCDIRLHTLEGVTDIRTSPVTNWYQGYPYAIGGIVIETRNSVYTGKF